MISLRDYDGILKKLAEQYLITKIEYVEDIKKWARKNKIDLNEPDQPMKLITNNEKLSLVIQSYISERELDNIIMAFGLRWSLIDNVSNIEKILNSVKKRLAYCFLKEYARTNRDLEGDDLKEDKWAMSAMERLEFFKE